MPRALVAEERIDAGGEPWSEEIVQVFTVGLAVKIVSYPDNDDRPLRICYNVVKHDMESNNVRWSTVHQKISCVLAQYQRHNDWTICQNMLLAMFGSSKKITLLRWIRCAKGLDAAVAAQLEHMPNVKQGLVFDNDYLMGTGAKMRMKMGASFALKALSYAGGLADCTVESFTDQVCKPLRVLEVWVLLMKKRYGSVAENSAALERTTEHLMSLPGLRKINGAIDSGVPLHGVSSENRGIPECFLLNREFGRCKAGGLPPPAHVPTDAQHEAILEAEKAARDASAAEEAKKQKEAQDAAEKAQGERDQQEREANDLMDTELLALSSPQGPAGVIAAGPDAAAERVRACKERVDETMRAVHLVPSSNELIGELNAYLASRGDRVVALVCPETSDKNVVGLLLDTALEAYQVFQTHHPGNSKFRILIFAGNRFDLISKAMEKQRKLPGWSSLVVQLCKNVQSVRLRPAYAVLLAPAADVSRNEATMITINAGAKNAGLKEGLALQCKDPNCPWLPSDVQPGELTGIAEEDKSEYDPLAAMLDEANEGEVNKTEIEAADLWPFAKTRATWTAVLRGMGCADSAGLAILLSTSAHPSHYLACRALQLETYVLTARWSQDCKLHSEHFARDLLYAEAEEALTPMGDGGVSAPAPFQEIVAKLAAGSANSQAVEAFDITNGTAWHDGLNFALSGPAFARSGAQLVRDELEAHNLRVSPMVPEQGRGLESTLPHLAEESVVCPATALFFDDKSLVLAFLRAPGNAIYSDRVVRIDKVMHHGRETSVWAVLIGCAQYLQHYSGIKRQPNCILEFDAQMGFNAGALQVRVRTVNKQGIKSQGAQLLLDYGSDPVPPALKDAAINGALDRMFADQKETMPKLVEEHEIAAQAEEKLMQEKEAEETAALAKERAENLAKEQDNKKKEEAEKAAAIGAEAARKRAHEANDPEAAKKAKLCETIASLTSPAAMDVVLEASTSESYSIKLLNKTPGNKKVNVGTVLASWTNSATLASASAADPARFQYQVGLKTHICLKGCLIMKPLDKALKEN